MTDRPTYSEHRPTVHDNHIAIEDRENWLILDLQQNRDSGPTERSNFRSALAILGGESNTVEVHRFGYWACGWYEIIIVDPTDVASVAHFDEITTQMENYPILDEMDAGNEAFEEFAESWNDWGWYDLRDLIKEAFELSENTADRLDDIEPAQMSDWWAQHARETYFEESSGINIPIRRHVEDMTRNDCAHLLQIVRQITNQQNPGR